MTPMRARLSNQLGWVYFDDIAGNNNRLKNSMSHHVLCMLDISHDRVYTRVYQPLCDRSINQLRLTTRIWREHPIPRHL